MNILKGHIIQYEYDDWSYIIRDIKVGRKGGEILYECISPEGGDHSKVWTHNLKELKKAIEEKDGIYIIGHTDYKPSKNFPKFKLT